VAFNEVFSKLSSCLHICKALDHVVLVEISTMDLERYMRLKARMQAVGESHPGSLFPQPSQNFTDYFLVIKYSHIELIEQEGKGGSPAQVIQKSAASRERDRVSPYGEYATVTREYVNAKGESERTDLEIHCETMQKALKSLFGDYSPEGFHANPIVFRKPYYTLFHCQRGIQDMMTKAFTTQEQRKHLKWLVDTMSEKLQALDNIQEGFVDKGLVTFQDLPIIFEAGSIIVGHSQGLIDLTVKREKSGKSERPECFLFHEISDELEDNSVEGKYRNVGIFRWAYNDLTFGLTAGTLRIREFQGSRKITDLECFPLKHLREEERSELVTELIARGKRWCDYLKAKTMNYKGSRTRNSYN